jgi:hypothetical protein
MGVTASAYDELMRDYRNAVAERDRLQRILDNRPAINAGLVEAYVEWSSGIYILDIERSRGDPM